MGGAARRLRREVDGPHRGPPGFDGARKTWGFLGAALVDRPALEQAKGVLVSALCVTPAEAHTRLRRVTGRHDVRLNDLTAALVEAAAGGRPGDPLLRKVLWQEWGERFPTCD